MITNRIQPAQVTIGVGYHVGRKRAHKPNQDRVGSYADITPDEQHLARKGRLYIVADGMGGAAGGDLASQMAVHVTLSKYYQDEELDVSRSLAKAVQIANQKIHERGHTDPVCWGMGTTIVAAVVHRNKLDIMNVGDSRAYLLRDQKIKLISTDHSLVQEQVRAGLLTQEEAAVHPRRNVLSRNLGYAPETYPDFATYTLRKGDMLLLCSDGLWGQVSDAEQAEFLQTYEPQIAADKLVDLANRRGGPDNISVIILRVDNLLFDDDEDITDPTPLLANRQDPFIYDDDDDDEDTDPTPLLANRQDPFIYDDDDEDTDPTPLLQRTEQIMIPTSPHHFDFSTDSDSTHVSNNHTTRKLRTTGTMVAPSGNKVSKTPAPALSDPTPNQAKRIFILLLIVFLIVLFVIFSMMLFDILPTTFSEMRNAFSMSQ